MINFNAKRLTFHHASCPNLSLSRKYLNRTRSKIWIGGSRHKTRDSSAICQVKRKWWAWPSDCPD